MRWTRALLGVAASLTGLATGTAMGNESQGERERGRGPTQRLEAAGYAASGSNFYVWVEDSRQGRRWAAELSRGAPPTA